MEVKPLGLFLGVDGGSTKTHAVIADAHGAILGEGRGGPSNYHAVGRKRAVAALHEAVMEALRNARLATSELTHSFLGLAGLTTTDERLLAIEMAREAGIGGAIDAHHDCYAALYGATAGQPGAVLIAGTGSSCFGTNAFGVETLVGGWGYLLGDEGSAFDIARRGLRAAVRAADGRGPATVLVTAFCTQLQVSKPRDVMVAVYDQLRAEVSQVAALAPVVFDAARCGDVVANGIIDQVTDDLARHVQVLAEELDFTSAFDVALIGGLFDGAVEMKAGVKDALGRVVPQANVIRPHLNPTLGALIRAMRLHGVAIDQALLARLKEKRDGNGSMDTGD